MTIRFACFAATALMIGAAAFPGSAHADAAFEMEMRDTGSGDAETTRILTRDGNLRMAAMGGDAEDGAEIIYRPADAEMLMLQPRSGVAQRITKQDLESLQSIMQGMRRPGGGGFSVQEGAGAPQGGGDDPRVSKPGEAGAPLVRPMGETMTVAGIDCEMVEVTHGGELTGEYCLADPDAVAGGAEMMTALRGLTSFFEDFSVAMGEDSPEPRLRPVAGKLPILSRRFENGRAVREYELVSASTDSLDSTRFEAPSDYTVRSMLTR